MADNKLTDEEKNVIELLTQAYNAHVKLDSNRLDDHSDFCRGIHFLQALVMKRPTVRAHPELLTNYQKIIKKDGK